jgi:acylphosphatase
MERIHLIISGSVTGVLFRSSTRAEAEKLGLTGWVKNVADKVEIVAEGPKEKLEKLVDWCKTGSPYSKVYDVKVSREKATGEFSDFQVMR